jgi:serine/threonine protein kinase
MCSDRRIRREPGWIHGESSRRGRPDALAAAAAFDAAMVLDTEWQTTFLRNLGEIQPTLAARVWRLVGGVPDAQAWFRDARGWIRPAAAAAVTHELDLPPGSQVGGFTVQRRLGEGGTGVVFAARDRRAGRSVALKVSRHRELKGAPPDAWACGGAALVAPLVHPNICSVHEVGRTEDGRAFIVMELCRGRTLERILACRERLSVREVARIGMHTCRGLEVLHERRLVHRDIKPANLMLVSGGVVKLLDFGVAIALDEKAPRGGTMAGTLAYMSPEQLRGGPLDGRADLWALGVVLWELATGARPFQGGAPIELIDAIETEPPRLANRPASRCFRQLHVMLRRLLHKDPDGRPGSASQVLVALRRIAA